MRSASSRIPAPSVPRRALPLLAVGSSVAASIGIVLSLPPNHDVAWLLYVGRRLLAGDRMFVDVVEVNPPLIIWISTAVASVARQAGLAPLTLYAVVVTGAAMVSALATYRLARVADCRLAPVVGLGALFVMLALPGYDFGQREHLLVILALPYVVAASSSLVGRRSGGVLPGVFAGIGFALKPYFLPAWLAVEVLLLWRRGRPAIRRPALTGVVAVLGAYAMSVLLMAPDYLVQAGRLAPWYQAFAHRSIPALLVDPRLFVILLLGLGAFRMRRMVHDPDVRALQLLLWAMALMLLAAVLMQQKGFSYHWYPSLALAVLATILCITPDSVYGGRLACTALLVAMPLHAAGRLYSAWQFADGPAIRLSELTAAMRTAARGRPVLALTARTRLAFPATEQLGLDWSSPYPFLWMLPGIFPHDSRRPADVRAADAVVDAVWRLVERRPPGVVLLESRDRHRSRSPFRQEDYFIRDPRFAQMLAQCRWKGEVAGLMVCELP